jgi:hypothetical protein
MVQNSEMTHKECVQYKAIVSTNRMTKGSPLIFVFVAIKNVDVIIVLIVKMTWHIEINYVKNLCFIINLSLEDISFCFEMGDLFIDILEILYIVFWKSHSILL